MRVDLTRHFFIDLSQIFIFWRKVVHGPVVVSVSDAISPSDHPQSYSSETDGGGIK